MEENPKKLSKEKYKEILDSIPICCVDIIIKKDDKILLVKRKNGPAKGQFWFPGGRIYKNEKSEDAALRKAREECSLNVKIEKKLGSWEFIGKNGPFEDLKSGIQVALLWI